MITYTFREKSIREILDEIFDGNISYKIRGKYVILTKAPRKEDQVLQGYVIDESTGKRLQAVSVYDPITLSSTITDEFGYFQLKTKNPTGEDIRLAINKRNYADTVLVVKKGRGRLLNISMQEQGEKFSVLTDSIGNKIKRLWISAKRSAIQSINEENVSDTLVRPFQLSFIPLVGTNGGLSGNVVNDYSINVLGGYALGNRRAELGGLFNVQGGDATGFQAAGLFNLVRHDFKGVQMAGLFNSNFRSMKGAQFGGLFNFNLDSASGIGFAGLSNFTRGSHRGVFFSGLFNFANGDSYGWYVSGVFNFSGKKFRGAQVSGVLNHASAKMSGTQLSGVLNVSGKEMRGVQIGLINLANRHQGAQLGLLNITDSIRGVPLGFLSVVRTGYRALEISADEIFHANIAFRTGIRSLYNIFTAGIRPQTLDDDIVTWSFGYGLGTSPRLSDKWFLNIDATASQVVYGKIEHRNLINRFLIGAEFQPWKHFSIATALTVNAHIYEEDVPDLFDLYKPPVLFEDTEGEQKVEIWLGARLALRFL